MCISGLERLNTHKYTYIKNSFARAASSLAPKTDSFAPKTIHLMHINSSNTLNKVEIHLEIPRNTPKCTQIRIP